MIRAVLLGAVLLVTAASSQEGRPGPSTAGSVRGAGVYHCHNEQSDSGVRSQCRPRAEDCEGERGAAAGLGLAVSTCVPVARVACFQLGGDPAPAASWCAATHEDCQFWRNIDVAKNGDGGQTCGFVD